MSICKSAGEDRAKKIVSMLTQLVSKVATEFDKVIQDDEDLVETILCSPTNSWD